MKSRVIVFGLLAVLLTLSLVPAACATQQEATTAPSVTATLTTTTTASPAATTTATTTGPAVSSLSVSMNELTGFYLD